jgi:hypothetical protein
MSRKKGGAALPQKGKSKKQTKGKKGLLKNSVKKIRAIKSKSISVVKSAALRNGQKKSVCSFPLTSGWITINKSRGKLIVYFSYQAPKVKFNIDLDYQWKKTLGGWGHSKFGPMTVNATWTLNIFRENSHNLDTTIDKYSRSYSKTFPSANHLQLSINPKTGQSFPSGTQFTYSVPAGWVIQKIYLTNVHCHGVVPGGAHGIDCDVSCS